MRHLEVNGVRKAIPPFPHHKDYVFRCGQFFQARSLLSFMSIADFVAFREIRNCRKYRCGIPRDILIDPTNACNLRCKGCWSGDYDGGQQLTYAKLDEILTEAEKLGTLDILMTGGEPLLRKTDILRLAERHRKLFIGIFTNATLIDEPFVERIQALGNIGIFASIEGFRDETDFRRGDGTFDQVIRAMELLKKHDIGFGFSLCYHARNWDVVSSDAFLDFLREQGAWFGWAFAYRPIGCDADLSLCLDAAQRETVRNRFADYSQRHGITIIDLFNSGHKAFGCVGAGSGYIHITANGDVEPCAFCHYSDANLHQMSLQEALQSPFLRAFRRGQPFSDDIRRPCPMMDVPEAIVRLVEGSQAHSTHLASPETAQAFAEKVQPIADEWAEFCGSGGRPYSRGELRRYRSLLGVLKLRQRLSGD